MNKQTFLSFILLIICTTITAQSVQYGYTEEYNGAKDKTPLANVNITAGGVSTKSGKGGKFKLEFKNLKVGDRVIADIANVAVLKGYVLFNKEALEQWTVSGKDVYFRIVLCKKKTFDNLVMTYYKVSDKSLKEQLNKEQANARKLKEQGEIQQQEYERLLREADNRYQKAIKNMRENSELVARIDESELEGNQAEILRLAKEGRMDEAVALIRQDSTTLLLEKASKKMEYVVEQEQYIREKKEEARNEIAKLIANLKNNIKILQLQGSKENYDLCSEYWQRILEADTTNLTNLWYGAHYFYMQNKLNLAEKYYIMALAGFKKLYEVSPNDYALNYSNTLNNLGNIYSDIQQYQKAEEYWLQAMQIRKSMAEKNPDTFNPEYANSLNNLGNIYLQTKQYQKAEEYHIKALQIRKSLAETNTDVTNLDYATSLNNLGNLYLNIMQYQKAEEYFLQATQIYKSLAETNPDTYNTYLAKSLSNLGVLYSNSHQYQKAEENWLKALQIIKSLAESNPDAYNPDLAKSLSNLGNLYLIIRQNQKGEEYILQALQIRKLLAEANPVAYNPDYALSLCNLGILYSAINQPQKSEEYFLQSSQVYKLLAETNPNMFTNDYVNSLNYLGKLYVKNKQYQKVEEYYLQTLQLYKSLILKKPETYASKYINRLGDLSFYTIYNGHFADAERYCREVLTIDPNQTWVNTNLVTSILFQGRYAEAKQIAINVMNIESDGKPLKEIILEDLTNFESAGIIPSDRLNDVENLKKVLEGH